MAYGNVTPPSTSIGLANTQYQPAPSQNDLDLLHSRLINLQERVDCVSGRLSCLADRLYGCVPVNPSTACNTPEAGLMDTLSNRLRYFEASIETLNNEASRLTGLA